MSKVMLMLVTVVGLSGCRHVEPARPVVVAAGPASAEPCIERVLRRVRAAGYVEQVADRQAGFVRVPFTITDRRGREQHGGFLQVQCAPDGTTATVVVGGWAYHEGRRMPNWLKGQVDDFTAQLFQY